MPKFYELFNPVLRILSNGEVLSRRELSDEVIAGLGLTDTELAETLAGGGNRAASRVHWASEHLFKAGAISRPTRGSVQITQVGVP